MDAFLILPDILERPWLVALYLINGPYEGILRTPTFKARVLFHSFLILSIIVFGAVVCSFGGTYFPQDEVIYFNKTGIRWLQLNGLDGNGTKIAILDTGINGNLSIFSKRIITWKDFLGNGSKPYDDSGHGTAVASIIAGGRTYDPKSGKLIFTGVAYAANLIVGKIATSDDTIPDCNLVVNAIKWAVELGANLINLSISCNYPANGNSPLDQEIDLASSKGVAVIASAGNTMLVNSSTISSPGDARSAITVGATNTVGTMIESYSGRGPTEDGRLKPDLVAPGGSPSVSGVEAALINGEFANFWWGTSFSTALVTGISALLKQADPSLTPAELKTTLESTASPLSDNTPNLEDGYGLVNGEQAYVKLHGQDSFLSTLSAPETKVILAAIATVVLIEMAIRFRQNLFFADCKHAYRNKS